MAWDAHKERRLLALWKRRATLDREDVSELWILLSERMQPMCLGHEIRQLINVLPLDPADYLSEFFLSKVFLSPGDDELTRSAALSAYFYRFLVSVLRKEHIPSIGGSGGEMVEDSALREPDAGLAEAFGTAGCHELDPEAILRDSLADPGRVAESARAFLRDCPRWGRLFLRLHDCADPEDGRMTRQAIAERFDIPSYQPNAYKLGVAVPKKWLIEGRVDYRRYADTLLGKWMQDDLGIPIHQDNATLILACLKILCQTALTRIDEQGGMP